MFFRRGRLSAKMARALLIQLFDHRYQWPLRMPIIHLLARGDPLRFLCSLRFLVDAVGQGVHLLNRRQLADTPPWFAGDLDAAVTDLPQRPAHLAARLALAMDLDDPAAADVELRRLMLEIIALAQTEKPRRRQEEEPLPVSWLPWVARLDTPVGSFHTGAADQANLAKIAKRAVRIVWRLPGSRLAALTGSVAAGYADLTSDIDISLFGLKLPDPSVRHSLLAATSSFRDDITQLTQNTYAADAFWLADSQSGQNPHLIDVRYYLIEEVRRLIERPMPESPADKELLAHLSTAQVLVDYEFRGPDLLHDLEQATRLARPERMTQASADLEQALTDLRASSDGPAIFYAATGAILALFQLLAARNDRWILFPKWTAAWLDGLEHVPADFYQRLSGVAMLPFRLENVAAKLETLRALAVETTTL